MSYGTDGKQVIDDYYEAAAIAKGGIAGAPAYIESYEPDIDNTTLAMPKVGNFAAPRGVGRPAYMKMARAFEFASAPAGSTSELEDGAAPKEYKIVREVPSDVSSSSEDDGRGGRRRKKGKGRKARSALHFLAIPQTYNPVLFGTIGGAAGPQFGGSGMAPFGEQWERSKARKPAPHLNGRNWMYEFSKVVCESNRAIKGVAREYSAYHKITLGASLDRDIEEEGEGIWELSGDEEEYETVEDFKKREGLFSEDEQETDELDDRKRGRTPSPSRVSVQAGATSKHIKAEEIDNEGAMEVDQPGATINGTYGEQHKASFPAFKKFRRGRSPLRGYHEQHTRIPQIRSDTQSTEIVSYERIDLHPHLDILVDEKQVREDERQSLRARVREVAATQGVSRMRKGYGRFH